MRTNRGSPADSRKLSERERERYARQLVLRGWGDEAQLRLKTATVFVAGAGGLGSAAILYLAAAGVGCIRVCDRDVVELSNLNRQILHTDRRIGRRKSLSARDAVARLSREVRVVPLAAELTPHNAPELAAGADVLLDCLDSVTSRLALNQYSVIARLPLVHAGVRSLGGQLTFLNPPSTPCLACFMREPDSGSLPSGIPPILGAVAGALGCLQALETLKYLTGIGERAENRLIFLDGETLKIEEVAIAKDPACPVCGR